MCVEDPFSHIRSHIEGTRLNSVCSSQGIYSIRKVCGCLNHHSYPFVCGTKLMWFTKISVTSFISMFSFSAVAASYIHDSSEIKSWPGPSTPFLNYLKCLKEISIRVKFCSCGHIMCKRSKASIAVLHKILYCFWHSNHPHSIVRTSQNYRPMSQFPSRLQYCINSKCIQPGLQDYSTASDYR